MIRLWIPQPIRRNVAWRYCAVVSLLVYIYSFYSLIVIIISKQDSQDHIDQGLRILSTRPTELNFDQHRRMDISDNFHSQDLNIGSTPANPFLENSHRTSETDEAFPFPGVWESILRFFQSGKTVGETTTPRPTYIGNHHSFDDVINASSLCQNTDNLILLVYVHSAPGNQRRRMVIRQTWGDVSQYDVTVRVVFVMGVSAVGLENEELQFEADSYGDIVQANFTDSYRNLTYKAITALRWVSGCGSRSQFVLKTDDDIFVNIFVLLRLLRLQQGRCYPRPCQGMLLCLVWDNMVAQRDGKWKVEEAEWKEPTYPRYCSGSAFILTTDVATSLYRASFDVPFFWVDDVYVTGLLPVRAGSITYTNYASYYLLDGTQLADKFTGSQWYNYVFSHVQDLNSILAVWRKVALISRGDIDPTIQFRVE